MVSSAAIVALVTSLPVMEYTAIDNHTSCTTESRAGSASRYSNLMLR